MKKIIYMLSLFVLLSGMGHAQTDTMSYVMAETMLSASSSSSLKSIQYFNGLGYPTVAATTVGQGGQTAYTLTTYDVLGREERQYLPVATDRSIDYKEPSEIISISGLEDVYNDNTAYTQNHYDALDRVISTELPGQAWRIADRRNRAAYAANIAEDNVWRYTATSSSTTLSAATQYYPAGSLTKETHWDADSNIVVTFKDLFGNVILQRVAGNLDTYYVYDEYGRLHFVLPPAYQNSTNNLRKYCYEYRYDTRGRITKKFLPGAEYIQYWYDKADRVICMQDGAMRKAGKCRFTIYDKFGHMVIQGLCSGYTHNANLLATATYNKNNAGFLSTGYTLQDSKVGSALASPTLEIVNYYDSYDFVSKNHNSRFTGMAVTATVSQTGQLTGSTMIAGNGEWLSQVMAYDLKGNIQETKARELGGRIVSQTNSYTFTNKLASSNRTVNVGYGSNMTFTESYGYNGSNNQKCAYTVAVAHGKSAVSLTQTYTYNALGQLQTVSRPSTSGTKTTGYTYDMHGWLTGITTNSFAEDLFYASGPGTKLLYNGNISAMRWKNNNYTNIRGYKFTYDGANRLKQAVYGENENLKTNVNRYNEKVTTYDKNGNIKKFERRGKMQSGSYGVIDNLTITYNGNQLKSVTEGAAELTYAGSLDYKGSKGSAYSYNENGSLVSDQSRGIAFISYDFNNNPRKIYFTNGNVTEYIYSATGQKLRTVHYTAVANITRTVGAQPDELTQAQIQSKDITDYMLGGVLVLTNNKIDKVLFDGGYCQATASGTADTFAFNFYNKDHLGNIREVVDGAGTVKQVTNYYPFGATYFDTSATKNPDFQAYKYNGKEFDKMNGLNTYDYGARQHEPILARWDRIDPLCEKYYGVSPYVYCSNNPITRFDPDGMDDYRYDDKTGQFYLMNKTDDKTDRVLGYHKNKTGEYEQNTKWYQTKIRMDGIEKGILSDGVNFKENDNVISVGGEGGPTVTGVENFVIELSEMARVEISGFEYSKKEETEVSNVYIGRYHSSKDKPSRWNTDRNSFCNIDPTLAKVESRNDLIYYVKFHTHLSSFSDSDKLQPSDADKKYKERHQKAIKKFIILTRGYSPIEY